MVLRFASAKGKLLRAQSKISHTEARAGSLYINTKDQKRVAVSIKKDGKVLITLSKERKFGSQVLLPLIEKLLKQNNLEFKNLDRIEVETGPGSFTGLRVGVSVANALGYSLGIPVNGKKLETDLLY